MAEFVSQYTMVYCDRRARGKAWAVLRHGQPSHETTRQPGARHSALRHGAGVPATWPHALRHGHGHDTTRAAHDTAMRARAWAFLCAPGHAGWVSWLCTLCTCSVFGLSIVSESLFGHCSSQKIFEKKN